MNRNRILSIDARWLRGGVGTYALNLVRGLRSIDCSVPIHVLTGAASAAEFAGLCDKVSILSAPAFGLREQLSLSKATSNDGVFHSTHYNAPLFRRGPLIVTIADVTPLLCPKHHVSLKSRICGARILRAIAHRADHVITVSCYSKNRIVELLGIPPDKITVAYNGVARVFHPMEQAAACEICRTALGIETPFLLYVGLIRPHKNVAALLRAFSHLVQEMKIEHRLVLIGDGPSGCVRRIDDLIRDLRLKQHVTRIPIVSQTTLVAAYCAADAVVQPSLEEGFGLPVLEAMACGAPVICSAKAALPEIGGEAAAYFDPNNPRNMADAIATVLSDPAAMNQMRRQGLARALQFTWAGSARVHYSVYKRFLD